MRLTSLILYVSAAGFVFLALSCNKQLGLDEWGGKYDEKSGIYQIVYPSSRPTVKSPINGSVSEFSGTFFSFDNLNAVTVTIENGIDYNTLTYLVYRSLKDDKNKRLTVFLDYVDASNIPASKDKNFRKEWLSFVKSSVLKLLHGKKLNFRAVYHDANGFFKGRVEFEHDGQTYDLAEWIIANGFSYVHKVEGGDPAEDEKFLKLQNAAKLTRKGLWSYDFR